MSALAHEVEERGVATVVISLVRPHSEQIRPPRTLWVPFQLGRPLGPPGNPVFQRHVLATALRLFEWTHGPAILLEDYHADEPNGVGDPAWRPPLAWDTARALDAAAFLKEFRELLPHYRRAVARSGRTTVGVSGLAIEAGVEFVATSLDGGPPVSPDQDMSPALRLRFAADDVKACWLEAAVAPGRPSSRQLVDWFWERTVAGQVLIRLRRMAMASSDKSFNLAGSRFLVPGARAAALDAADIAAKAGVEGSP